MPRTSDTGTLVARILISLIFIGAGFTQIGDPSKILHMIGDRGLPLVHVLYVASTVAQLAGGLSILLGWQARWGAALLLAFILPATLLFHLKSDQSDIELFTRDLAIAGGLILLLQQGPGARSLDFRRARRRTATPSLPKPQPQWTATAHEEHQHSAAV
jgi:putative oxidoreductase